MALHRSSVENEMAFSYLQMNTCIDLALVESVLLSCTSAVSTPTDILLCVEVGKYTQLLPQLKQQLDTLEWTNSPGDAVDSCFGAPWRRSRVVLEVLWGCAEGARAGSGSCWSCQKTFPWHLVTRYTVWHARTEMSGEAEHIALRINQVSQESIFSGYGSCAPRQKGSP